MEEDNALLEKLFSSPLVTHAEVKEEYLEALARGCERGVVGWKLLQEHGEEIKIYWLKNAGPQKLSKSPSVSTPNKRKFVSPLLHQITSSSKKHKLVCNYSSAEEKQVDGMCGGGEDKDSVCTGEEQTSSPTLNEVNSMTEEKKLLQRRLEEKKEKLRKLKLVKMYRVKNNLEDLEVLVDKWRAVSQDVAEQLLAKSTRRPPPTMADLLEHLHIDPILIHYSTDEEAFY